MFAKEQASNSGWAIPDDLVELFEERQVGVDLLQTFLVDAEARLLDLKDAFHDRREEDIRNLAHRLRGSCSQFGADGMVPLVMEMEMNPANNLCDDLEREFLAVQLAMQEWLVSDWVMIR